MLFSFIQKYGGLCLDWDVHVLRSLAALRQPGFFNIVDREPGGINSWCWMSQPGTTMMEVWIKAAHARVRRQMDNAQHRDAYEGSGAIGR